MTTGLYKPTTEDGAPTKAIEGRSALQQTSALAEILTVFSQETNTKGRFKMTVHLMNAALIPQPDFYGLQNIDTETYIQLVREVSDG